MSNCPDYYSLLQVDPRAEREVVDAAYRRLAAKYHPDIDSSPGATERMKLINAAYDVISHPEKRREYDLTRGVTYRIPHIRRPQPNSHPREGATRFDWTSSLVVTGLMLALSVAGPRFGVRAVLIVGLALLGLWLLTTLRKR